MFIKLAADVLLGGGVIVCPTEGVFGLSCMPDDPHALLRVLTIKQRDPRKGLILIAAHRSQFEGWVDVPITSIPAPDASRPTTWIVPAATGVAPLVRGNNPSVAVRMTTNPIARALCELVESPLVSTSANRAGEPPVRNQFVLRRKFKGLVDYIVPGDCGPSAGPSEIRNLATGQIIRSRSA